MKTIGIRKEPITLGQLLKLTEYIQTGGEAKFFLREPRVKVNGVTENRRGKKIFIGDVVTIDGVDYKVVSSD